MKVVHYDIFAGIGGFSLAADWAFGQDNVRHIFCEIDPFCRAILAIHWSGTEIHGDIRDLIEEIRRNPDGWRKHKNDGVSILTAGFPCQPFSVGGKRLGRADSRYLWNELFEVIELLRPQWLILENVPGILTIEGGMVWEEICTALEGTGYATQTLVIPALAVGAPHLRKRVWLIAHAESEGLERENATRSGVTSRWAGECDRSVWQRDWREVALERCNGGVDDGLPGRMDGITISPTQHRKERMKALGNAIVPQVAYHLFLAIRYAEEAGNER